MGRTQDKWYKSQDCEKALELIEKGYSVSRVAEMLGVEKPKINYAKRLYGVKSVRGFTTNGINYNDKQLGSHNTDNRKSDSDNSIALLLLGQGFSFVEKFHSGSNAMIKMACLTCGKTTTRKRASVRNPGVRCEYCEKRKAAERIAELVGLKQQKAEARKQYKIQVAKSKAEQRELEKQARLTKKHICKECGKEFTLKEFGEREHVDVSHYGELTYCSLKCRRNADNRRTKKYNVTHGKHRLRAIKYGTDFDKSVNLDDLIKRDGLCCALCGGTCDLNDKQTINGVVICGNNYPSIDHIKAMAKGGSHTWDNVQVAHRICNARKGTEETVA